MEVSGYDDWKLAVCPEDEEDEGCPSCGGPVSDHERRKYHGHCSAYCRDE